MRVRVHSLSASLWKRGRGGAVTFQGTRAGLTLPALVDLGQEIALCPSIFIGPHRRKADFKSADWGYLDLDKLAVDGAPTVEDLDRRFTEMGLAHATVLSKSHLKDKNGVVAERAHFLFPLDRPCLTCGSFRATMESLAVSGGVRADVDGMSFVATQPLWPGSAVLNVWSKGHAVEVIPEPVAVLPLKPQRPTSTASVVPEPPTSVPSVPSVEAAEALARQMPPSIQGKSGSKKLYAVANRVIHEARVSEDAAVRAILQHFNPRCMPPWEEKDIRRAVAKATENTGHDPKKWRSRTWTPRPAEERAYLDSWPRILKEKLSSLDELRNHGPVYSASELLAFVDARGSPNDRVWLGKVMKSPGMGWKSTKRGKRQEKVYVRPSTWTADTSSVIGRIRRLAAGLPREAPLSQASPTSGRDEGG